MSRKLTTSGAHRIPLVARFGKTSQDLIRGFTSVRMWWALSGHDIKSRYRGSILGPFWITLTLAMAIAGISMLFGDIFQAEAKSYFPLVGVGLALWIFISTTMTESCRTYIDSAAVIKQSTAPLSLQPIRIIVRNLIAFAHHLIVIIPLLYWSGDLFTASWGWAMLGFGLLVLNLFWMAFFFGIICARFRDVPQVIGAVLMMGMFVSPIFWRPGMATRSSEFVNANPFTHMIEGVRAPLTESYIPEISLIFLIVMCVAGWIAAMAAFFTFRHRVVYYV